MQLHKEVPRDTREAFRVFEIMIIPAVSHIPQFGDVDVSAGDVHQGL